MLLSSFFFFLLFFASSSFFFFFFVFFLFFSSSLPPSSSSSSSSFSLLFLQQLTSLSAALGDRAHKASRAQQPTTINRNAVKNAYGPSFFLPLSPPLECQRIVGSVRGAVSKRPVGVVVFFDRIDIGLFCCFCCSFCSRRVRLLFVFMECVRVAWRTNGGVPHCSGL